MLIGTLWKDKFSNQLNAVAALGLAVYAIAVFLTGVTNFEFASLCSADLALIVTVSYASYRWQRDRLVRYAGLGIRMPAFALADTADGKLLEHPDDAKLNQLFDGRSGFFCGRFVHQFIKGRDVEISLYSLE